MQKLWHFAEASALTEASVFDREASAKSLAEASDSAEAAKSRFDGTLIPVP